MQQQLLPVLLKKPQTGGSLSLLKTLCVLICNVAQPHTPLLVEHFCHLPLGTRSTLSCNCELHSCDCSFVKGTAQKLNLI